MSIETIASYRLKCDGCGKFGGRGNGNTEGAARVAVMILRSDTSLGMRGWLHRDGKDFCPRCKEKV